MPGWLLLPDTSLKCMSYYNFHNVVVFGKEDGIYHVAEPVLEDTQILTYKDLLRVRFAKGMFEPKGKMYYIESVTPDPDIKKAIFAGIKTSVKKHDQKSYSFCWDQRYEDAWARYQKMA